jgi:hypothetical protein
VNYFWLAPTDSEGSAFGRLESHAHGGDVVVDIIDQPLVTPGVGGDKTEVISIGKSDEILSMKIITKVCFGLEKINDGLKSKDEGDWGQTVTLENSSSEGENVTFPGGS